MPLTIRTERKSSPNYNLDPRVRCIDELQRISRDARNDYLGDDWAENARKFYSIEGVVGKVPSFRPQVQIPQLQVLSITEATEVTDISPKVFVYSKTDGSVDTDRSKSLQEEWKSLWVNHHLMFASLWAQFCGIGFLQFGYDPFLDNGFGEIWCRNVAPDQLDIDSAAQCRGDATYMIKEDRYYPDQIAYYWPETGVGIQPEAINPGLGGRQSPATVGTLPPKLRFPDGPMRQFDGPVESEGVEADGRLRTRYLFIDDRTVELTREEAGGDSAAIVDKAGRTDNRGQLTRRLRFPDKRLIVCVSGRTSRCVADGSNPTPGGVFPFIPIYGLPPLSGFYPPPPTRYSRDLQALCERTLTQVFENLVRLNNGIWFMDKNAGIDAQAFQGLPAEIVEYDGSVGKPPTFVTPPVIQDSVMKLVQWMLSTQKELQGFNQSREGTPGAGNLSAELYEASIFQSKALTRCRARLLAHSVSEAANLVFDMMSTYYQKDRAYATSEGGFSMVTWKPYYGFASRTHKLHIDPTSLLPISQAAMRQMAPLLKQAGAIDTESLLEALGVPDAANIAARTNREMALQALQKAKRR
jgi:hypothetical protein